MRLRDQVCVLEFPSVFGLVLKHRLAMRSNILQFQQFYQRSHIPDLCVTLLGQRECMSPERQTILNFNMNTGQMHFKNKFLNTVCIVCRDNKVHLYPIELRCVFVGGFIQRSAHFYSSSVIANTSMYCCTFSMWIELHDRK